MRIYLLCFLAAFAATAFATDPPIDTAEAENQFTQATVDAAVIDSACAQTRTDRRICYQRASTVTAQCREQLEQQYQARGEPDLIGSDQYIAELKTCAITATKQ